jgi:hypothetical protein
LNKITNGAILKKKRLLWDCFSKHSMYVALTQLIVFRAFQAHYAIPQSGFCSGTHKEPVAYTHNLILLAVLFWIDTCDLHQMCTNSKPTGLSLISIGPGSMID